MSRSDIETFETPLVVLLVLALIVLAFTANECGRYEGLYKGLKEGQQIGAKP